jgi:hypothetical protein
MTLKCYFEKLNKLTEYLYLMGIDTDTMYTTLKTPLKQLLVVTNTPKRDYPDGKDPNTIDLNI